MTTATRSGRVAAALTAFVLALAGTVVATPIAAYAADGFSVDDFAGNAMGERVLVPGNYSCSPSGSNNLTVAGGTMKLDITVPDTIGCNYGSAQVRWTAPTMVDIEQGGADRIDLRYRDVLPNQPSAVTFGVRLVDVDGRVAEVGGLTRNGGPAGDWLTIRYVPAYVGDVAVFNFANGFRKDAVKSVTLIVAATTNNQNVSVTFDGIGTNVGEPAYEAPSIGAPTSLVFPPSTATVHTFTVTGNPAPDVAVSGQPAWMTAATSSTTGGTLVTLSGNPGTSYSDTSIHVHADVANSLTADRDVRIVVPSPVSVTYTSTTTTVGQAGPITLGTAASTPVAGIVGPTTGLPAGTSLSMSGTSVVLTGTPTTAGDYSIATTVGNEFTSAPFTRAITVGQAPVLAAPSELVLIRNEPITPVTLGVTAFPTPTFTASGLPAGLSLSAAGVLSGTPTANTSASATITAQNSFGTDDTQLSIQVGDRPGVTPPTEGHVVAGSVEALALDTIGDPVTVTASGLPAGLSVAEVSGDWVVRGTPARPTDAASASGVATFTVTSAFGADHATWSWNVDAAPALTGPGEVSTVRGSALTGATVTLDGYPTPTVTVTDTNGDPVVLPDGLSVDTSTPGAVRIIGSPTTTGTAVVRVTASNGVGASIVHDLTVRSLLGPSFFDAAPTLTVEAGNLQSLTLNWVGYERPTLSTAASLPSWIDVDTTSGTIVAEPPLGVSGIFGPYDVVATNTTGSATASVTVVVNTPAALATSSAGVTVQQGVALASTLVGSYAGYPAPTVTTTGLPAGLSLVGSGGSLQLSGTTTAAGGTYPVTVRSDNGIGTSTTATLSVTVTVPATVSAASDASIPVGVAADIPIVTTGFPAPVLHATGLPTGLSIDALTGNLTGTPTVPGDYTVTITASNGIGDAPAPVDIAIEVRSAPVVTLDVTSATPGGSVVVAASGFLPGESVRVEFHSTPRLLANLTAGAGGAINASVSIPLDAEIGAHNLVVIAASGAQGSAPLTVAAAPAAASLSATGTSAGGDILIASLLLGAGLVLALVARRRRGNLAG